jgi:TonB family protein
MLELRCLLGMTVLLGAAEVVTRLAGRRWAAAERQGVWVGAVVVGLLLPLLLRLEPPVEVLAGPVLEAQRVTVLVGAEERSLDYAEALRWIWLAGVGAVGGWWLLGFVRVAGMVASSVEHSTFEGVAVRMCAGLRVPAVAAGPVILLPRAAEQWPEARLDAVLRHERAHVHRRDLWWRLAGTLACAVYWFHPLAWRALAQIRRESEMACDDQVLQVTGAGEYAESLVAVAREAAGQGAPAAVVAMAKPREIEGRLLAVLDPSRRRGGVRPGPLAAFVVSGLLLLTPLGAWQGGDAQMRGTVRDMVGVIPGAKVVLKGTSDYTFESGPDGAYSVAGVPEGVYTIEVLKPGYARLTVGSRKVEAGKTARADFYLSLGKIQETLTVDGGKAGAAVGGTGVPGRIRVSGNVQAAKVLKMVRPLYPAEAKAAGVQGTVRMQAIINREGDVADLTLLMAPSAELARSAMEAVGQWKYSPTLLNGNPVEIQTVVDVNYTLAP